MKIAIIGAGNVGGSLGRAWAFKGHEVVFGVRDATGPKTQVAVAATAGRARAAAVDAAVRDEVVVLAVPFAASQACSRVPGR
jgi:8-hydroxy-5-deazaflavin:NADPH oxidoreductase